MLHPDPPQKTNITSVLSKKEHLRLTQFPGPWPTISYASSIYPPLGSGVRGGHTMAHRRFFLSLALVALASMFVTVDGQQNQTPTTVQRNKSTVRKIYEEDQKDRSDVAGDASPENS